MTYGVCRKKAHCSGAANIMSEGAVLLHVVGYCVLYICVCVCVRACVCVCAIFSAFRIFSSNNTNPTTNPK